MENNIPLAAKKIWNIVRAVYFMMRKGIISKRKFMLDLNMLMKRGNKIANKAIGNLMFHHHHHHGPSSASTSASTVSTGPLEYEFSCTSSPAFPYQFPLHMNKRKTNHNNHFHNLFACTQATPTNEDDLGTFNFDKAQLEMLSNANYLSEVEASPMLPGFGRTPLVRPLRITDSPFPLKEEEEEDGDGHQVDKAAAEFIEKFYEELRKQK